MPEFRDRERWEGRVGGEISGWLSTQEEEVIDRLGEDFDQTNIEESFWERQRDLIVPILATLFGGIFSASVAQLPEEESLFIPVDITTVQDKASRFAQQHSFNLVSGINETTRSVLQSKVSQAIDAGWDTAALREALAPQFGPTRAAMIAQTETTRAAIEGEIEAVAELERAHQVAVEGIWQTNPELSATGPCPICQPLDGKVQGVDWFDPPPAHPRCVCSLNYRKR